MDKTLKGLRDVDITTLFFVGSASSGKTSIIRNLLEGKVDGHNPTLALDFTFARRTTADLRKEVCHIWELGGDAIIFSQLIEAPIRTCRHINKLSIVMVIDLSLPEKIWPTLEIVVTQVKSAIKKAVEDNSRSSDALMESLQDNVKKRLGPEPCDTNYTDPLLVPIGIICSKYDVFQNYEPERRKIICRALRLAAHYLGASLIFYSEKDIALTKRVKEFLIHYSFDGPIPKDLCKDYNAPILVPAGSDSFDQIWPNSNPSQYTMAYFRHFIESSVGNFNYQDARPADPADDPSYREPEVDSARSLILQNIHLSDDVRKQLNSAHSFSHIL